MRKSKWSKLLVFLLILTLFSLFFYLDLHKLLSFDFIKQSKEQFEALYQAQPLRVAGLFFLLYTLVTALSIPGAAVLTLMAGFLFHTPLGLLLVSFASSLGATLAFLMSRFLLRDYVQNRFHQKLKALNAGIKKEGPFYLFTLRLIPIVPFFVINLAMGLTPIRTWTFYWVSQLSMLPGTFVYVNAGTQLGQIESLGHILSWKLILSFAALGLLPWFAKGFVEHLSKRRILKKFSRPKKFDFNVLVIGAGSGGLVASYIASTLKAKVALIEKNKMGGDCLNTGCVPSKALIRAAKAAHSISQAPQFGISSSSAKVDFTQVMQRVHQAIRDIEPHDSVERYTQLGVHCLQGKARLLSPWEVHFKEGLLPADSLRKEDSENGNEQFLTARAIIIATGASPYIPPLQGLDQVKALTSENLWELTTLPKRLVLLGGGPIGCEMAQSFCRLGSQVSLVEMGERLLPKEDPDVSDLLLKKLESEGMRIHLEHKALRIEVEEGEKFLICATSQGEERLPFDEILFAVGRKAHTKGFGLEELGVEISDSGTISHDEFMRTNFPSIFVCGDVAGPYQFTHTASHQAYYACLNALFGSFHRWLPDLFKKPFRVDESAIPWATFTDPEVATVGLNEQSAKLAGIEYEVTSYDLSDLDRAIADGENYGFVKVLTAPGKDRILGATIVGSQASNLLAEFVLAMKAGLGLNQILSTIHVYPTHAEANKYAAGQWKRLRKPEKILQKLQRFFAWQRG